MHPPRLLVECVSLVFILLHPAIVFSESARNDILPNGAERRTAAGALSTSMNLIGLCRPSSQSLNLGEASSAQPIVISRLGELEQANCSWDVDVGDIDYIAFINKEHTSLSLAAEDELQIIIQTEPVLSYRYTEDGLFNMENNMQESVDSEGNWRIDIKANAEVLFNTKNATEDRSMEIVFKSVQVSEVKAFVVDLEAFEKLQVFVFQRFFSIFFTLLCLFSQSEAMKYNNERHKSHGLFKTLQPNTKETGALKVVLTSPQP
ncbi:unnamed protein product [Discosporangium mesarthrocarpum]